MAIRLTNLQKHQREQFIQSAAIRGQGAVNTLRSLQDMGLPMRKTDVLRKYREYAQIPAKQETLKYIGKQKAIGPGTYIEQEGFMTKRFRYRVAYETYNKTTGETKKYYTNVITNTQKLPWQVEQEADKAIMKSLDTSPFEVQSLYVAVAEHRAGDTWQ